MYVGNLPWDTTPEAITEFFQSVGTVSNVTLLKKNGGRFLVKFEFGISFTNTFSKGSGFVEFESSEFVNRAIEDLHGAIFGGRTITVKEDIRTRPSRK